MSIQAVAWALDQHIPDPGAKLVLLSLCNAYNGDKRACHPSHARIATEASCSRRTVIRKLEWLEENGWIASVPRFDNTGRSQSNMYIIHMSNEGDSLTHRGDSCVIGEGVTGDTQEGDSCVTPLKGTVRSIVTKNRKNLQKDLELAWFDEFWALFPNKVGKPAARKSFSRALKKTTFEELMAGLRRYIAATLASGRMWCNPTTFLNQERWADEPASDPQRPSSQTIHPRLAAKQSAIDELFGDMNDEQGSSNTFEGPFLMLPTRSGS